MHLHGPLPSDDDHDHQDDYNDDHQDKRDLDEPPDDDYHENNHCNDDDHQERSLLQKHSITLNDDNDYNYHANTEYYPDDNDDVNDDHQDRKRHLYRPAASAR